jgi:hypothetical protein
MFFPASLNEAVLQTDPSEGLILLNDSRIQFMSKVKYFGSIVTPLLNEDSKIDAKIKKAKYTMGYSKNIFDNKDVDCHLKYLV